MSESGEVLHKIRAKLYPNYLPSVKGKYIARSTRAEAPLSVEQVCRSAKERGGYTGSVEDLIAHINGYNKERTFLWADGFATKDANFSVYPRISGTFESETEPPDRRKHKVEIVHRESAALRKLFDGIELFIEGTVEADASIDEILDITSGRANEALTPDGLFVINGRGIRIAGEEGVAGVFFVDAAGAETPVLVSMLAENQPSKVIGKTPALAEGTYTVKVVTQYSRGTLLKAPRVIESEAEFAVE